MSVCEGCKKPIINGSNYCPYCGRMVAHTELKTGTPSKYVIRHSITGRQALLIESLSKKLFNSGLLWLISALPLIIRTAISFVEIVMDYGPSGQLKYTYAYILLVFLLFPFTLAVFGVIMSSYSFARSRNVLVKPKHITCNNAKVVVIAVALLVSVLFGIASFYYSEIPFGILSFVAALYATSIYKFMHKNEIDLALIEKQCSAQG